MKVQSVWYQSEAGDLGNAMQLELHSYLNPFQSYGQINFIGS